RAVHRAAERRAGARLPVDAGLADVGPVAEAVVGRRLLPAALAALPDVVVRLEAVPVLAANGLAVEHAVDRAAGGGADGEPGPEQQRRHELADGGDRSSF